ncbi:MAG: tetratricopeptide repeat protein [Gemmatimonadales bacterium]
MTSTDLQEPTIPVPDQSTLRVADEHLAAERWAEAAQVYTRVLSDHPSSRPALLGGIQALRQDGGFAAAQRMLNRAFYHYPDDGELFREQGLLFAAQGKIEKALASFRQALVLIPTDQESVVQTVGALLLLERYDEARVAVDNAPMHLQKSRTLLLERARLDAHQERYDQAMEGFVEAGAASEIATVMWRLSDDAAEQLLDAVLDRLPDETELLRDLAQVMAARNRMQRGLAILDGILERQPADRATWVQKIEFLRSSEKFAEAETAIADAYQHLGSGTKEILAEHARLFAESNRPDQAVAAFIQADDIEGLLQVVGSAPLTMEHGLVVAVLEQRSDDMLLFETLAPGVGASSDRLLLYERILQIQGTRRSALMGRIQALRDLGRFAEAEVALEKAEAQSGPEAADLVTERGQLALATRDYPEAVRLLREVGLENDIVRESSELRQQRRFVDAEALLNAALEQGYQDTEVLAELARGDSDRERYDSAESRWAMVLSRIPADLNALANRCYCLRAGGRPKEAVRLADEALRKSPENEDKDWRVRLLGERGWAQFAASLYGEAEASLNEALELDDSSGFTHFGKILVLHAQQRYVEAEGTIGRALQRIGHFKQEILAERGRMFQEQGQLEAAEKVLAEATQMGPSSSDPWFYRAEVLADLNRTDEANALLDRLATERPNDNSIREGIGFFYLRVNKRERAKAEFAAILQNDPKALAGINGMGGVHMSQGRPDLAEQEFREAMGMAPNMAACSSNLAWALVQQARAPTPPMANDSNRRWQDIVFSTGEPQARPDPTLAKAEEFARRAIELRPGYSSAYACLGSIAFKRGLLLEAEDFLKKSIAVDPLSDHQATLGALYAKLGRYKEAEQILEAGQRFNRFHAQTRIELGNVYLQTKRGSEAVAKCREAQAVDPDAEEPARALAVALMHEGEHMEAGRVLRAAIARVEPAQSWQLHLTLCRLLTDLGDKTEDEDLYEEARKEARQAIALHSDHPEPHFHAGIVCFKLKDFGPALRHFRKTLSHDPCHFDAEQNERKLKALRWREAIRTRGGYLAGIILSSICLILLCLLWSLYLYPPDNMAKGLITERIVQTTSPILLGLVFVAFLLPWLSKLKLPGVEAELSQPQTSMSLGPASGTASFGRNPTFGSGN